MCILYKQVNDPISWRESKHRFEMDNVLYFDVYNESKTNKKFCIRTPQLIVWLTDPLFIALNQPKQRLKLIKTRQTCINAIFKPMQLN
jgi:hypothetical protein